MNPTRLLILGVVRILQPVHGYDVRRELLSWQLDDLVNVQPGSVYSALRTLEKDGLIAVASTDRARGRPARTRYVLTGEGETQFGTMLRAAWWRVDAASAPLMPALALMPFMSRVELIAALDARVAQLEGKVGELAFVRSTIRDGATGADGEIPEHVREGIDFSTTQLRAEIAWARRLQRRLRDGWYVFADEPGALPLPRPEPDAHGSLDE